jgi:hypothetical protein
MRTVGVHCVPEHTPHCIFQGEGPGLLLTISEKYKVKPYPIKKLGCVVSTIVQRLGRLTVTQVYYNLC